MSKFIVFEGLDGSGKSTQIKMLTDYLTERQIGYQFLHFPRMHETLIGEMIARFLRGELGKATDINPYFIALMYAQDRTLAKEMLLASIAQNEYFIVDRYVYSNIAFQCAKLPDQKEKEELRNWILELEYRCNALPKPDLTLYLKVPFEFIKNTLSTQRSGQDREYLKGHTDIHENDLVLQKNVESEYLALVDLDPDFKAIECENTEHQLLTPAEIHARIIKSLTI